MLAEAAAPGDGTTELVDPARVRYAPTMELLRDVVVLLHIVGFAVTFGAWAAEAAARRFRTTRLMDYGLLLSLLTGLALAAPWPAGIELNYPKIGIKLVILVVIGGLLGMGNARQRRTGEAVPRARVRPDRLLVAHRSGDCGPLVKRRHGRALRSEDDDST